MPIWEKLKTNQHIYMILTIQSVDVFKEQTKKIQIILYSEFHVTNLQLNKLHNKTLRNQVSVMVSLMTL